MFVQYCGSPGRKWIRENAGWREDYTESNIIAESIQMYKKGDLYKRKYGSCSRKCCTSLYCVSCFGVVPGAQVKKIIESFLRRKQEKAFRQLFSNLLAAPVSKCSVKERVMWLQISSTGSKECHGYSTLGELFRRLNLTESVSQQGRFHYIVCLAELIVQKKLLSLSGMARRQFFNLIETLVQRVINTHERIRQMKKIVSSLLVILMKRKNNIIGSNMYWFDQIDTVRGWQSKLNQLSIIPRLDNRPTVIDLPISIQRHIVSMLDNHEDVECLSMVNKTFSDLCNDPIVWKKLCHNKFAQEEIEDCESFLERRHQQKNIGELTWRRKYYFLWKKYGGHEYFADPLLLCKRCNIVFWKVSGHPCVEDTLPPELDRITPTKLISFFENR